MVAIISLVKYQSRLDSKISSIFSACYQYYNTERFESIKVAVCSSVQIVPLALLGVSTADSVIRKILPSSPKQTKQKKWLTPFKRCLNSCSSGPKTCDWALRSKHPKLNSVQKRCNHTSCQLQWRHIKWHTMVFSPHVIKKMHWDFEHASTHSTHFMLLEFISR